jgi:predicted regulator of Ras-like GTPase activity (Roadblock/LC7/MglB family)
MFTETLTEIAGKLGHLGCILLMGMDGLPIEKVIIDNELNVEALTAEFPTLIKVTGSTTSEVNAGSVDELIVMSDQMIMLTKSITADYFLLLVLAKDGNLGRARFELKKAVHTGKEFV